MPRGRHAGGVLNKLPSPQTKQTRCEKPRRGHTANSCCVQSEAQLILQPAGCHAVH